MTFFINNFIGGQWSSPLSQNYLDNYAPATGEVFSRVADSSKEDLDRAVEAAQVAQKSWAKVSVESRCQGLHQLADLIEANKEELAEAESLDTGKLLTLARGMDIARAVQNFRFYADAYKNFNEAIFQNDRKNLQYVRRKALGVVGIISPWNLPLYLLTWKIAPALVTGNAVIAKPSEITPYTAMKLCELIAKTDLPSGVFNLLHGRGAVIGEAMCLHPDIKAISFTGGSVTGKEIYKKCASTMKKVSLEMGGKNPALIFDDCHYEEMLNKVVQSSFTNQGQVCLCTSRLFVQEKIYQKFKNDFVQKVKNLQFGALTSLAHLQKVSEAVKEAKKAGGKILCGGDVLAGPGYFYSPTVIEGLDYLSPTNQKEIFGPVVTLIPFRDDEQVIEEANAVEYGLCASVWTQNLDRAFSMSEDLECGMVWVNDWVKRDLRTPFGGVKSSGLGREGGEYSLRFFTEEKNISFSFF